MNSFFKCQKFLQNIFFQTPVVQKFLHLGFKKFHQSTSSNRHFIFSWDNNSFQTSEGLQAATRNNMDSTNFIEEIEAQFILRVLVKYWPEGILSHFHTAWGKFCTVTLSKYHIRGSIMLQFNMWKRYFKFRTSIFVLKSLLFHREDWHKKIIERLRLSTLFSAKGLWNSFFCVQTWKLLARFELISLVIIFYPG